MANRTFKKMQALASGLKYIVGVVKIVGDTTPTNAVITADKGIGYSVARTGTGEYTITLQDKFISMFAANLTLEAATAIDLVPQIKSVDVVSAKTIVFVLNAAATPTDSANTIVHKVHFSFALKNSSAA